mgnify:FL=1
MYKHDKDTRDFVHMMMSLALLPPEHINQMIPWLRDIALSSTANKLIDYYERIWIRKWSPFAVSVFQRRIRTNNDLEGNMHLGATQLIKIRQTKVTFPVMSNQWLLLETHC